MSEWKKVKIGDFLTEREGRYKPDDKEISKHKRLEKIDFSGINVAKGAVAVYQGNEPVCATIHYSSYTFDSSKVDLDYFKYFVKSPAFIATLQKQVKGGIKTEIKPRHLLPLEISIPDLQTQQEIVKKISSQLQKTERLSLEIESQKSYIKQLRQNILQQAIEGKLTEDWRKKNPVQKGNPDYDAEALFEQIQKERINEKKQKELSPITDEDLPAGKAGKPFEIPKGWKWVRLGEIIKEPPRNGYSPKAVDFETPIKTLKLGAVTYGIFDPYEYKYINEEIPEDAYCWLKNGDFLIERSNSIEYVGICAIYTGKDNEFMYPDLLMRFKTQDILSKQYIHTALISPFNRSYFMSKAKGAQKTMPKINQECVVNTMIPLPPLKEQEEIVNKVETLLAKVTTLESQIQDRKSLSDKLIFGIIKENLEG